MSLSTPSSGSVVWEAALGRRVVLVEARTWFAARDKARALLGGEPVYVEAGPAPIPTPRGLWAVESGR